MGVGGEKERGQGHTVRHGVRGLATFWVLPPRGPSPPPTVSVRAVGDRDVVWVGGGGIRGAGAASDASSAMHLSTRRLITKVLILSLSPSQT